MSQRNILFVHPLYLQPSIAKMAGVLADCSTSSVSQSVTFLDCNFHAMSDCLTAEEMSQNNKTHFPDQTWKIPATRDTSIPGQILAEQLFYKKVKGCVQYSRAGFKFDVWSVKGLVFIEGIAKLNSNFNWVENSIIFVFFSTTPPPTHSPTHTE